MKHSPWLAFWAISLGKWDPRTGFYTWVWGCHLEKTQGGQKANLDLRLRPLVQPLLFRIRELYIENRSGT